MPTGPKEPRSTVLSVEEEAVVVAFRRHTLLPLDDCLQPTIPRLTRSSLHRCLQRHGVSRLPQVEGDKEPRRKFKTYPIGFFHVDIAEVQTAQGKLYLFVAIDRTSKFAVAQFVPKANTQTARAFLEALVAARALQGSRSCSPTMESNSPTCQRTDQAQPPSSAAILSTASVGNTGSNIG